MPGSEDAKAYLLRARHCLDIASAVDRSRRLILLEMAQAWTRLAEQAERNRKSDLVYETPARSQGGDRAASRGTAGSGSPLG
jgi:hypothetical protein